MAKAAAESAELELFRYIGGPNAHILPVPMMNIVNGGAHADSGVDIQEFMIAPIGAPTFREALRWGPRSTTRSSRCSRSHDLGRTPDEGGFAPTCRANTDALDLIARTRWPGSPRLLARDIKHVNEEANLTASLHGRYLSTCEPAALATPERDQSTPTTGCSMLIRWYGSKIRWPKTSWDGWVRLTAELDDGIPVRPAMTSS